MRILYVCTGNSFRSPAAEALTRRFNPELEVESAGTDPVGFISEPTTDFLRNHGAIEFVKPEPDKVSQRALDEADRVVCMMPEHVKYIKENFDFDESKIVVWNIKDGIRPGVEPMEQLEKILQRVREL